MSLAAGSLLKDRWQVKEKIGGGSFGEVFLAYDLKKEKDVAIKTELKTADADPCLRMEFDVLMACQDKPHFCKLYGSGEELRYNFLVMQICGPSVSGLKKKTPLGYFSPCTSLMILIQCIDAVKILHQAGYLHRDLKPSNFALGRYGSARRTVYIIDFGLSRRFINDTCQIRSPRISCNFRGTTRYASTQIHLKRELGRVDDLWSLFYMLVEMMAGKLPWHNYSGRELVLELKQEYPPDVLTSRLPGKHNIMNLVNHLSQLRYADMPDYHYCAKALRSALWEMDLTEDSLFDWEENFQHCRKKVPWMIKPKPG